MRVMNSFRACWEWDAKGRFRWSYLDIHLQDEGRRRNYKWDGPQEQWRYGGGAQWKLQLCYRLCWISSFCPSRSTLCPAPGDWLIWMTPVGFYVLCFCLGLVNVGDQEYTEGVKAGYLFSGLLPASSLHQMSQQLSGSLFRQPPLQVPGTAPCPIRPRWANEATCY